MEFRLQTAVNHDEEIARADYPMIHLFQVKKLVADQPMEDVVGASAGLLAGFGIGLLGGGVFLRAAFAAESARADGADRKRLGRNAGAVLDIERSGLQSDPALKYVGDYWDKVLADYPAAKRAVRDRHAGGME